MGIGGGLATRSPLVGAVTLIGTAASCELARCLVSKLAVAGIITFVTYDDFVWRGRQALAAATSAAGNPTEALNELWDQLNADLEEAVWQLETDLGVKQD